MRSPSTTLRVAFVWAIPTIVAVVLSQPIGTLLGSGPGPALVALLLGWLVIVPSIRAAADVSCELLAPGPSDDRRIG